jgi:hypothetical protein
MDFVEREAASTNAAQGVSRCDILHIGAVHTAHFALTLGNPFEHYERGYDSGNDVRCGATGLRRYVSIRFR